VLPIAVVAGTLGAVTFSGLRAAAVLARLATGCVPLWPRRVRLIILAAVIAAGVLLVATEGAALAARLRLPERGDEQPGEEPGDEPVEHDPVP
jgi:hypothetical protein